MTRDGNRISFSTGGGLRTPGGDDLDALFARMALDVGPADIDGLVLSLQPGFEIEGQVFVDPSAAGADLSRMNILLRPTRTVYGVRVPQIQWSGNADWRFRFEGVPPSEYRIQVTGLPDGAYVRESRFGAVDPLNGGFDLAQASRDSLDLLVASDSGSLDVTVRDNRGDPVPGVRVVLVPDPPRRQRLDLHHNQTTGESGDARFEGVAPGNYRLFSWEQVESGAWQSPEFLARYQNLGEPVQLAPLGTATATVRLIPD